MTIQLVEDKDCSNRTKQFVARIIYEHPKQVEKQLEQPNKPISLQLIDKEECSTSAKLTAEKMTKHQIGWAIRTGDIEIPKWDKRYKCKYYDKDSATCSLYTKKHCTTCKDIGGKLV